MKDTGNSTGWSSWSLSIVLHLVVVAGLAGGWFWFRKTPPPEERLSIEASVVTSLPGATSTPTPAPEPEPEPELAPEPEPPEPAPLPTPPPPPPRNDVAEKAARAEAARVAEAERVAEQRRVAEARLAAQRKADQAAKEKADREKKDREKADQLKAQREKEDREKADQLRKQRELRDQAEMESRLQRETELDAQRAEEKRVATAKAGAAGQQYIARIRAKIENAWNRPVGATAGTQCEIRVTQTQTGVVADVQVGRCNRDDTVRQSIEDAVFRASPLPQPTDPALFDRNLTITFRPEN